MIRFVRYIVLNSAYPSPPHPVPGADVRLGPMPSSSTAIIGRWHTPFVSKVATFLWLGLMLLSLGVVAAARSRTRPEIEAPAREFLPGSEIHQICSDPNWDCKHPVVIGMSGLIRLSDRGIDVYYELNTNKIIRTIITTYSYEIGELIIAWGFPTGFYQSGTSIIVSWGKRSAFLETASFNPKSRIQSIVYDLDAIQRPRWRGWFGNSTD